MVEIVTLSTSRDAYDIREAAKYSMTVGDLISYLKRMDEDSPVVFSNDNGYTYGTVCSECIDSEMVETREEEEYREKMEELNDELLNLNMDYEHVADPDDEDDVEMTEEQYLAERERILKSYGVTAEEYEDFCRRS